jgi:hypothetical protein
MTIRDISRRPPPPASSLFQRLGQKQQRIDRVALASVVFPDKHRNERTKIDRRIPQRAKP